MESQKPGKGRGKEKIRKITRREFLHGAGSLVGGAAITSAMLLSACSEPGGGTETSTPSDDIIYSPDTQKEDRIPPGQYVTEGWPVLQYGPVTQVDVSGWEFTISGLVEKKVTLDYLEFIGLPRVKVFSDVHCVTGWSRLNNLWEGPSSRTIAGLVDIKPEAKYVIVKAEGTFTSNFTMEDFLQEDVLFAIRHDDRPLANEHGAPVRLVVPRLYFWKSAKWATGVIFTDTDYPGFWESAGYHNHGDPWKEERYQS